jgi:glycosyltransferase involved in cell wall biosynthesis
VGDRTFFTGFLSEATLAELYRRSAAFVMPSRGEGFGLVYLEAMKAAKPVLAARGSAAEEIVVNEKTGLLVDPEDREALREALDRLVSHPGEARRMGEAGRERWRSEFGAERFRERITPLLESLLARLTS